MRIAPKGSQKPAEFTAALAGSPPPNRCCALVQEGAPVLITIVGSFVSPYVRKVLACLNLKGLDYEIDPITPFFGNDPFEQLSPLCRFRC
jgi:hypothetical protein